MSAYVQMHPFTGQSSIFLKHASSTQSIFAMARRCRSVVGCLSMSLFCYHHHPLCTSITLSACLCATNVMFEPTGSLTCFILRSLILWSLWPATLINLGLEVSSRAKLGHQLRIAPRGLWPITPGRPNSAVDSRLDMALPGALAHQT